MQANFRAQLIDRAGNRCEAWERDTGRCSATTDLQAHHTEPGNDDPWTGLLLCRAHHKLIDMHAR